MKTCSVCSKELPFDQFYETAGHTSACKACEIKRVLRYHKTEKGRYTYARAKAKHRGLTFSLTQEEYASLLTEPCHYCHGELDAYGIALDRVDNNSGYIPGNVVPCCGTCNRVKSDEFSYEQMVALGAVISQFRKSLPLSHFSKTKEF